MTSYSPSEPSENFMTLPYISVITVLLFSEMPIGYLSPLFPRFTIVTLSDRNL